MGLLKKQHQHTRVAKNIAAGKEKAEAARKELEEAEQLKVVLRKAIAAKGFDIAKMFKVFDTNGDGMFTQ